MQRLVRRLNTPRLHPCRHRLDALALAWQKQPGAIGLQRRHPVSMTQCRGERLDIGRKTRFTRFDSVSEIHRSLHLKLESPFSQSIVNEVYDTVVLAGC